MYPEGWVRGVPVPPGSLSQRPPCPQAAQAQRTALFSELHTMPPGSECPFTVPVAIVRRTQLAAPGTASGGHKGGHLCYPPNPGCFPGQAGLLGLRNGLPGGRAFKHLPRPFCGAPGQDGGGRGGHCWRAGNDAVGSTFPPREGRIRPRSSLCRV